MESSHELFRRTLDGVIGVGFVQTHTGMATAAVAWPDGEPKRYLYCDLEGYGVEHVLDEQHGETQTDSSLAHKTQTEPATEAESQDEQPSSEPASEPTVEPTEDEQIGEYLLEHGLDVTNKSVIDALRAKGVIVQSGQVTAVKEQLRAE